jgi:hypothetical protein
MEQQSGNPPTGWVHQGAYSVKLSGVSDISGLSEYATFDTKTKTLSVTEGGIKDCTAGFLFRVKGVRRPYRIRHESVEAIFAGDKCLWAMEALMIA